MKIEFHDFQATTDFVMPDPSVIFDSPNSSEWTFTFKMTPDMVFHLNYPGRFSGDDVDDFIRSFFAQMMTQVLKKEQEIVQDYKIKYGLTEDEYAILYNRAVDVLTDAGFIT